MSSLESEHEALTEISLGTKGLAVTRVLIGADSALVRHTLESVLTTNPTFQLVGSFSIDEALAKVEDLQADVVLLDLPSRGNESLSLEIEPAVVPVTSALLVLSDDSERLLRTGALRSALRGMLPREAKPEELFAALQGSAAGLVVLDRMFLTRCCLQRRPRKS
jgi:DNA-binding NarL/FixJ family response regulator